MQIARETLVESLLRHAANDPGRPALLDNDAVISYGELAARIAAAAQRLRELGVERQQRVLICGENSAAFAIAYFAIHLIGATAAPCEPHLPAVSAAFVAQDCGAVLALVSAAASARFNIPTCSLEALTAPGSAKEARAPLCKWEDIADILYTNGTTWRKKGVLLTQRGIASTALNICSFIRNDSAGVELMPLPLSHSFGLGRLRCMAFAGNTLALEPGLPNPARLLKRALNLNITGLAMTPTGFAMLLALPGPGLTPARRHLRYIEIGSAPISAELRRKLVEQLPRTRICHHYGLTEASRACFREFHADAAKPDSIGRASPNVTVEIRDENGRKLGPLQAGEIAVRGAMVMGGYLNLPELTRRSLINGWLLTGDYGSMDDAGYIHLHGRRTDIINVGGLKVAPLEVEARANEHPAIRECACVGVPDRLLGERVKLFYVADHDVAETTLVNWLRTHLEEYKIPRDFERLLELPKAGGVKIQRHLLRERVHKETQLA